MKAFLALMLRNKSSLSSLDSQRRILDGEAAPALAMARGNSGCRWMIWVERSQPPADGGYHPGLCHAPLSDSPRTRGQMVAELDGR